MHFPISGVETYWWLPPLVAFGISCLTSTGGLSGAFLLLPFQVSALGFTGPAVTPTNLVFNIVAIPSGVYRYYREKRMVWPLAGAIIIGTLPGMFVGAFVRVTFLPDLKTFKPFVGFVLAYIGVRLLKDALPRRTRPKALPATVRQFSVTSPTLTFKQVRYEFNDASHYASTWGILMLGFVVGMIGGAYGIGGGAIVAPFLVTVFGLPVYTVAGAALLGTFVSSIAGVVYYVILGSFHSSPPISTSPDWLLGALFGIGGFAGVYVGARLQRHVPARFIKAFLALCVLSIAVIYISEFFL
ncbi:MAG: sulfite exporter TauE/SafE family protein [Candidatus Zixiibacteriota bacterium]